MQNLLLSGGVGHPFETTSTSLAALFESAGVATTVVAPEHWDSALSESGRFDVISVNALRWRMLPSRYDHLRDEHAFETSPILRDALEAHLARGRPLLALHTSCICFDDWPLWGEILGACWDWDRSFHPAHGTVRFRTADGTSSFPDEVYHGLKVTDPERDVLATAAVPTGAPAQNEPPLGASGAGEQQPVIWKRVHDAARVLVDTLGHDRRSLSDPLHAAALRSGLVWLLDANQ